MSQPRCPNTSGVWFSGVKYTHGVVPTLPKMLLVLRDSNSVPVKYQLCLHLSPGPWRSPSYCWSLLDLSRSGTSCKWDWTVFVLLCPQAYFIERNVLEDLPRVLEKAVASS